MLNDHAAAFDRAILAFIDADDNEGSSAVEAEQATNHAHFTLLAAEKAIWG